MKLIKPFTYFFDPILQTPLMGTMLVSFFLALIGVVFFLRKESLLGEALSHGAYPGIILGALITGSTYLGMFLGGSFFAAGALLLIIYLRRKQNIHPDLALLFVLSIFFGLGITIASRVQFLDVKAYRHVQTYLYGQSTLITSFDCLVYALFAATFSLFILLFYRRIQMMLFDGIFSKMHRLSLPFLQGMLFIFLVASVVFGIRSVGIVLISGMLVAPAVAARQWTQKLSTMFLLAALFALFSSYIGTIVSAEVHVKGGNIPMGPFVVFTSVSFAFFSLLIAPKKGYLFRMVRIGSFRIKCIQENLLKSIWKRKKATTKEIVYDCSRSSFFISVMLLLLRSKKWIKKIGNIYFLTPTGEKKASQIIRLHRLWELYLTDYLGLHKDRVHPSAEEMEHILTRDLEKKIDHLLDHPKRDPHLQPIPPAR